MTIKEIAQMADVSISTVSKIMNRKDKSISPETRERVLRIAKEFHYTPHSSTFLNSTKTFVIGLLIHSCDINRTTSGILEAARSQGYSVMVTESNNDPEEEYKGANALCNMHVDAVLWEPVGIDDTRCRNLFHSNNIPFLQFNTQKTEYSLYLDFKKMGMEATSHLVRADHRNIACLLTPGAQAEQFLNGYKQCLFEANIPFQDYFIFHEVNEMLLHSIVTYSITAVVSSHFSASLQLYGRLNNLHYHIPYDVSLVSLKKDIQENVDFPLISTITIPYYDFGKHVCHTLIQSIEHGTDIVPFDHSVTLDNSSTILLPFDRQKKKLTVVGSINIDNYLNVKELPANGKTVMTTNHSVYPGGKAINQAIGATLLGGQVNLIGAIGNDMDSNLILSYLNEHMIDCGYIRKHSELATGKAYIFVQPDGNSMISILSGANDSLLSDDIRRNERAFSDSNYCLIQTEVPQEALIEAAKLAQKHGAKTILKPSACSYLLPDLLKQVNILVPNLNEINILCPDKTLRDQAETFLEMGIETVIVTLGERGCYLKTLDKEAYFSACSFTSVDSTGASDAFICALAVYLQKGYSIENAIKVANYAAGFSISREGVTPSLIDRNTLESYIRQKEPDILQ